MARKNISQLMRSYTDKPLSQKTTSQVDEFDPVQSPIGRLLKNGSLSPGSRFRKRVRGSSLNVDPSKFDRYFDEDEFDPTWMDDIGYIAAERQGNWGRVSSALGRILPKIAFEIGKSAGYITGSIGALASWDLDKVNDNAIVRFFERADQQVKDFMPVNVRRDVEQGGFFKKTFSSEFLGNEFTDAVGFLVAAIATGAGFSAAAKGLKVGTGIANVLGKGQKAANIADDIAVGTLQSVYEAGSEMSGNELELQQFYDNLERTEDGRLIMPNGRIISPEDAASRIENSKSRSFWSNMIALTPGNIIQTNMLFGAADKLDNGLFRGLKDISTPQAIKESLKNVNVTRPTMIREGLKGIGTEGFQEWSQFAVGEASSNIAKGEKDAALFSADYFEQVIDGYKEGVQTIEGWQSIALGSFLGLGPGVFSGYKQAQNLKKQRSGLSKVLLEVHEDFDSFVKGSLKTDENGQVIDNGEGAEIDPDKLKTILSNTARSARASQKFNIALAYKNVNAAKAALTEAVFEKLAPYMTIGGGIELWDAHVDSMLKETPEAHYKAMGFESSEEYGGFLKDIAKSANEEYKKVVDKGPGFYGISIAEYLSKGQTQEEKKAVQKALKKFINKVEFTAAYLNMKESQFKKQLAKNITEQGELTMDTENIKPFDRKEVQKAYRKLEKRHKTTTDEALDRGKLESTLMEQAGLTETESAVMLDQINEMYDLNLKGESLAVSIPKKMLEKEQRLISRTLGEIQKQKALLYDKKEQQKAFDDEMKEDKAVEEGVKQDKENLEKVKSIVERAREIPENEDKFTGNKMEDLKEGESIFMTDQDGNVFRIGKKDKKMFYYDPVDKKTYALSINEIAWDQLTPISKAQYDDAKTLLRNTENNKILSETLNDLYTTYKGYYDERGVQIREKEQKLEELQEKLDFWMNYDADEADLGELIKLIQSLEEELATIEDEIEVATKARGDLMKAMIGVQELRSRVNQAQQSGGRLDLKEESDYYRQLIEDSNLNQSLSEVKKELQSVQQRIDELDEFRQRLQGALDLLYEQLAEKQEFIELLQNADDDTALRFANVLYFSTDESKQDRTVKGFLDNLKSGDKPKLLQLARAGLKSLNKETLGYIMSNPEMRSKLIKILEADKSKLKDQIKIKTERLQEVKDELSIAKDIASELEYNQYLLERRRFMDITMQNLRTIDTESIVSQLEISAQNKGQVVPPNTPEQTNVDEGESHSSNHKKHTHDSSVVNVYELEPRSVTGDGPRKIKRDNGRNGLHPNAEQAIRWSEVMASIPLNELGQYSARVVDEKQLAELGINNPVPKDQRRVDENGESTDLFFVLYKQGEPYYFDGGPVFAGVAHVDTYYPDGFKPSISLYRNPFWRNAKIAFAQKAPYFEYDGNKYTNIEDLEDALWDKMEADYTEKRSKLLSAVREGQKVYVNPLDISKGEPVEIDRTHKTKNKPSTLGKGKLILPHGNVVSKSQNDKSITPVASGMPHLHLDNGQVVRLYNHRIDSLPKKKQAEVLNNILRLIHLSLWRKDNMREPIPFAGKSGEVAGESIPLQGFSGTTGALDMWINFGDRKGKPHGIAIQKSKAHNNELVIWFKNVGDRKATIIPVRKLQDPNDFTKTKKYDDASIYPLVEFLKTKFLNVNKNSLDQPGMRSQKYIKIPTGFVFDSKGKPVVSYDTYKGTYEDYLLENYLYTNISQPKDLPAFVNQYMVFDLDNLYDSPNIIQQPKKKTKSKVNKTGKNKQWVKEKVQKEKADIDVAGAVDKIMEMANSKKSFDQKIKEDVGDVTPQNAKVGVARKKDETICDTPGKKGKKLFGNNIGSKLKGKK